MDFFSLLTTFLSESGTVVGGVISVINTAILIWLIVVYLPKREKAHAAEREKRDAAHAEEREKRDESFLQTIESYRQTLENFQQKEDESHKEIIRIIHEHDKHTLEANLKIAMILKELERTS